MPASPDTHHVLVVDDNADIREAMAMVLESAGWAVVSAASAEAASRALDADAPPCVVLLDIHMPDVDGWTFCDRLRAGPRVHDVAVVVVSGDVHQRERARRTGYEFVLKPMAASQIFAVVGRNCRRHALPAPADAALTRPAGDARSSAPAARSSSPR